MRVRDYQHEENTAMKTKTENETMCAVCGEEILRGDKTEKLSDAPDPELAHAHCYFND